MSKLSCTSPQLTTDHDPRLSGSSGSSESADSIQQSIMATRLEQLEKVKKERGLSKNGEEECESLKIGLKQLTKISEIRKTRHHNPLMFHTSASSSSLPHHHATSGSGVRSHSIEPCRGMIDGELIRFEHAKVRGDGNCGLTSLGAFSRDSFVDLLLSKVNEQDYRNQLAPDILNLCREIFTHHPRHPSSSRKIKSSATTNIGALFSNQLTSILQSTSHANPRPGRSRKSSFLSRARRLWWVANEAELTRNKYAARLSREHLAPTDIEPSSESFLRWLQDQGYEASFAELKKATDALQEADQACLAFCTHPDVYTAYLNVFRIDKTWVSCHTMILYAKAKNIQLRIWQRQPMRTDGSNLTIAHSHSPKQPVSSSLDILFTRNYTHFDLLYRSEHRHQPVMFERTSDSSPELPSKKVQTKAEVVAEKRDDPAPCPDDEDDTCQSCASPAPAAATGFQSTPPSGATTWLPLCISQGNLTHWINVLLSKQKVSKDSHTWEEIHLTILDPLGGICCEKKGIAERVHRLDRRLRFDSLDELADFNNQAPFKDKDHTTLMPIETMEETDADQLSFHPSIMRCLQHLYIAWQQLPNMQLPLVVTVTGTRQYDHRERFRSSDVIAILAQNFIDVSDKNCSPTAHRPYYKLTTYDPELLLKWHARLFTQDQTVNGPTPTDLAPIRLKIQQRMYLETHARHALQCIEERLCAIDSNLRYYEKVWRPFKETWVLPDKMLDPQAEQKDQPDAEPSERGGEGKSEPLALLKRFKEQIDKIRGSRVSGRELMPHSVADVYYTFSFLNELNNLMSKHLSELTATRYYVPESRSNASIYLDLMTHDIQCLLLDIEGVARSRGLKLDKTQTENVSDPDLEAFAYEVPHAGEENFKLFLFRKYIEQNCSFMYIACCAKESRKIQMRAQNFVDHASRLAISLIPFGRIASSLIDIVRWGIADTAPTFLSKLLASASEGAGNSSSTTTSRILMPLVQFAKNQTKRTAEGKMGLLARAFSNPTECASYIGLLVKQLTICYRGRLTTLGFIDIQSLANTTARHIQEYFFNGHYSETCTNASSFVNKLWPWMTRQQISEPPKLGIPLYDVQSIGSESKTVTVMILKDKKKSNIAVDVNKFYLSTRWICRDRYGELFVVEVGYIQEYNYSHSKTLDASVSTHERWMREPELLKVQLKLLAHYGLSMPERDQRVDCSISRRQHLNEFQLGKVTPPSDFHQEDDKELYVSSLYLDHPDPQSLMQQVEGISVMVKQLQKQGRAQKNELTDLKAQLEVCQAEILSLKKRVIELEARDAEKESDKIIDDHDLPAELARWKVEKRKLLQRIDSLERARQQRFHQTKGSPIEDEEVFNESPAGTGPDRHRGARSTDNEKDEPDLDETDQHSPS